MNPERIGTLLTVVLVLALGAWVAYGAATDPMAEEREMLAYELDQVPLGDAARSADDVESAFVLAIAEKPQVWDVLVPLPKPKPPPPRIEPCPNIRAILNDVAVTRAQVGDRAQFLTAGSPRGEFLGVGDVINGCTISEVTPTHIVFTLYCQSQDKTLTATMPRQ